MGCGATVTAQQCFVCFVSVKCIIHLLSCFKTDSNRSVRHVHVVPDFNSLTRYAFVVHWNVCWSSGRGHRQVMSSPLWRGGVQGCRKGPFQILLAVAWDFMAGWAPGRCPWALQQRQQFMCPASLSYCTDSCCLCGIVLPLCGCRPFFVPCFCLRGSEAGGALAADAGNQYVGKQWKIREVVDLRYPAQK